MTSRVARIPIKIPTGVDLKINGREIIVKGKLGELKKMFSNAVKMIHVDGALQVTAANETQDSDAQAGTMRAILQNMVAPQGGAINC